MKLRTDLLKHATFEETLKEATANNHRYKPEPVFSQNWSWELVVCLNRGVCERGATQHGQNPESFAEIKAHWDHIHTTELSLGQCLDFLRLCHRRAPFLFFNGNTFAEIARTFSDFLFAELPTVPRRHATSSVAHYVAGVLDRNSLAGILDELCQSTDL